MSRSHVNFYNEKASEIDLSIEKSFLSIKSDSSSDSKPSPIHRP